MEIWKDIIGYEGLYQVSDCGRVRSLGNGESNRSKPMIIKSEIVSSYLRVTLSKNGVAKHHLIHRLVAEAFLPNPLNLQQVNHKDEDKTNNNVDNLEWCDCIYNINYGTGIKRRSEKEKNGIRSKKVIQYSKSGEFIREWPSTREIQRVLGYNSGNISSCCLGKTISSYGYKWKYKEVV